MNTKCSKHSITLATGDDDSDDTLFVRLHVPKFDEVCGLATNSFENIKFAPPDILNGSVEATSVRSAELGFHLGKTKINVVPESLVYLDGELDELTGPLSYEGMIKVGVCNVKAGYGEGTGLTTDVASQTKFSFEGPDRLEPRTDVNASLEGNFALLRRKKVDLSILPAPGSKGDTYQVEENYADGKNASHLAALMGRGAMLMVKRELRGRASTS